MDGCKRTGAEARGCGFRSVLLKPDLLWDGRFCPPEGLVLRRCSSAASISQPFAPGNGGAVCFASRKAVLQAWLLWGRKFQQLSAPSSYLLKKSFQDADRNGRPSELLSAMFLRAFKSTFPRDHRSRRCSHEGQMIEVFYCNLQHNANKRWDDLCPGV